MILVFGDDPHVNDTEKWDGLVRQFLRDQSNPDLRRIFLFRDHPIPPILKTKHLEKWVRPNPTQPTPSLEPNTCLMFWFGDEVAWIRPIPVFMGWDGPIHVFGTRDGMILFF